MAEKNIQTITLECLMNRETWEKYSQKKIDAQDKNKFKKEKRFYRRRIYDLTRQLLHPDPAPAPTPDSDTSKLKVTPEIQNCLDAYAKACIDYFKGVDKTDILQEEYKDLEIDRVGEINIEEIETAEQADQLMMRSIKIREPNNLEKIVPKKIRKVENPEPLPQQKNVNLKDPLLKNKGIRKKKNIHLQYDKPKNKNEKTASEIQDSL